MNINDCSILDIATYEWIDISQITLSQFSNPTVKTPNRTRLVAQWRKNDDGQLYCYWSSS